MQRRFDVTATGTWVLMDEIKMDSLRQEDNKNALMFVWRVLLCSFSFGLASGFMLFWVVRIHEGKKHPCISDCFSSIEGGRKDWGGRLSLYEVYYHLFLEWRGERCEVWAGWSGYSRRRGFSIAQCTERDAYRREWMGTDGKEWGKCGSLWFHAGASLLMKGKNHEAHGICETDRLNGRNEVMASRTTTVFFDCCMTTAYVICNPSQVATRFWFANIQ